MIKKFKGIASVVAAGFLFLLPGPSIAQQGRYVPGGLSPDETRALEIHGLYDKALNGWQRLRLYDTAVENFRRTGLLARCTAITQAKPDDFYFDPAMRAALDGVVDKMLAGKIVPVTLQDFRYFARVPLWAQRHAGAADWQATQRLLQTPAGQRALQRLRALGVMSSYPDQAVDINTGNWLAYPPIALKAYFTQSGQLDAFERALQSVNPELRAAFSRVRTVQAHGASDLSWLRDLSQALERNIPALRRAFVDGLPEDERRSMDELNGTAFLHLMADAVEASAPLRIFPLSGVSTADRINDPRFRGMTAGDRNQPNYLDFVSASLDSEYPQSAEQFQALLLMAPRQFIDEAHRPFCPTAK